MASHKKPLTARVQVYLSDPKLVAALTREAKTSKQPLSQAAGRAIARGLRRSVPADPDDRLLALERRFSDHARSTSRDLQIVQELQLEMARAFFERLPDSHVDLEPTVQAAVERRIDRLLDTVAARMVRGRPSPDNREADLPALAAE